MATYKTPKSVKPKHEDTTENIVHKLDESAGKFEKIIEKYRFHIAISIAAIVLGFLGLWGYHTWVKAPSEKAATEELAFAQKAYEMDSLALALNGNPANLGFVKIADQYSSTKAGNIAKYFAGATYYRLGDYDKAISYFSKFSSDDLILSAQSIGMIGDAYAQVDKAEEALSHYAKAAQKQDNDFTSPFYYQKAGNVALYLKKYDQAAKYFQTIKDKYPKSTEAATVEKYLEFANAAK